MTTNWTCFFFLFCLAHSQVGQLVCLCFYANNFCFFTKKIGPNNNYWCYNHTFSYLWMFNKGIKLPPHPPLSPLFKSSILPYESSHPLHTQVWIKKIFQPINLNIPYSTPIVFLVFLALLHRFRFHKRVWVRYIDRKMFKSLYQIH